MTKAGRPKIVWQPDPSAKPERIEIDTSFGRRIRLAYIEARLFLDNEINTTVIKENLAISRQQAHADLHLYLQTYGMAASYNPRLKRWIRDGRRKPRILKPDQIPAFARYVESIKAMAESGSAI